ncbi:MAG: hypothetical protein IPK72_06665 [Candidatus Eisenbacteria bacterium]|nr:hypothetical protein [Candidatus Eisenbacteria bacterium]
MITATRQSRPSTPMSRRGRGEEGSTLLIALLILGALSVLASSVVVTAMGDRTVSKYQRHALQALGAAETGIAMAKRAIVDRTAELEDVDEDGRPDFVLEDSLAWGGVYRVAAEASDIKGLGVTAYQSNGFSIVSEGEFLGAKRRVKVEIVHDSFLKFARFVSVNDLSYECGAAISGEVYTGGDLNVPCSCTHPCQFLESVFVVGDIPNVDCAEFYRGYVTDADTIDLGNSFDWTETRNKARGLGADNSCERRGEVGIYISLPGTDPLGIGAQAGADQNVIIFDRFNFANTVVSPGDTVITYNSVAVPNTVSGSAMRPDEFNGIIFFEGQGRVKGTMNGVSARNVTIFATTTNLVMADIITGLDGFDPVTFAPNGSGNPVNIGMVAESYVGMHNNTKRVLRVDAALLSRTSNWRGLGGESDHPSAAPGPLDLDLDGIIGESPVNHDPVSGEGWNELTITSDTWVLNINGPIITTSTGSAAPWNNSGVLAAADGPTRRYNYDLDMTQYPPPCYPVPLNLWKDVSWTELFEVRSNLADNLPN